MISKKTLRRLIWAFKFLTGLQAISFYWDDQTQSLVLKTHKQTPTNTIKYSISSTLSLQRIWYKGIGLFNIIFRIGAITSIALNLRLRQQIKPADIIYGVYHLAIWSLTFPTIVLLFIWDSKFVSYVNSLLSLNTQLGNYIIWILNTYVVKICLYS